MNGYEYIRNLPDTEISGTFGVSIREAIKIRNSTIEEMIKHDEVCPEKLKGGPKGNCHNEVTICNQCRKEFLENETAM